MSSPDPVDEGRDPGFPEPALRTLDPVLSPVSGREGARADSKRLSYVLKVGAGAWVAFTALALILAKSTDRVCSRAFMSNDDNET